MTSRSQIIQHAALPDGGTLAYTDSGGSGVAVIDPLSFRTTLAGLTETHSQRSFLDAIGAGHQFIAYDQRGAGESAQACAPETWEQRGADLWAVVDAAGVERAVLYGVFDSGFTIAHAALQQPDRVLGLVFNFVPPVFVARSEAPAGLPAALVDEAYGSAMHGDAARQVIAMRAVGINGDDAEHLVEAWQRSTSPEVLDRLQALLREADVRPLAPCLQARALVIEPQRRALIAGWGQALAGLLPSARLVRPINGGEMIGALHGFLSVVQLDAGSRASRLSPALSSAVEDTKRSVGALHRILVPVDAGVASERAVEMACRLGEQQQAEVVLVHVIEIPLARSLEEAQTEERHRGAQALRFGQAIVEQHGLMSRARLLNARSAAGGILRAAAEERVDLIVMALAGPRERDAARGDETIQEVLRRAPCEVLIDQSHGVTV